MTTQFLLSILVSAFSLALVLIGIPAQIKKNYQEKRSGQPLLTKAWLPLASFVIGIAMWGVTLIQYFIYEGKHEKT